MLKTGVLNSLISKSEKISFGKDYLRITLTIDNSMLLIIELMKKNMSKLDLDNSNFGHQIFEGKIYTYQKVKLSNGTGLIFSLSYFDVAIPVFILLEYGEQYKSVFNSWGKIDFYGSFFRLRDLGLISNDFYISNDLKNKEISRIDFRIDFFNYFNKIISYKNFEVRKNSKLVTYKNNGYINSWCYGDKKNKTVVFRGYDKKLDIAQKNKFRLYGDYQEYDSIFRLEWEFLNKFCKGFTINTLPELENKIKKYIGLEENSYFGKFLFTYEKIDLSNEFEKQNYIKTMMGYIRNAFFNQINVYDLLDIELEKMGYTKNDIDLIKNGTINCSYKNILKNKK